MLGAGIIDLAMGRETLKAAAAATTLAEIALIVANANTDNKFAEK